MSSSSAGSDAFDFWTDEQVVGRISELQEIQKRTPPFQSSWLEASSKLQPLFAEMSKRQKSSEGAPNDE